jgi:hypothetical protein
VWLTPDIGYILDSAPYTNGTQLIETSDNNMIFVTFNYRVGLFGFLAGKDVKEDGDLNVGLLDQRLVLKWIQEHISKVRQTHPDYKLGRYTNHLNSLEVIPTTL